MVKFGVVLSFHSEVPHHIGPRLRSGPRPDEECDIWTRQRGGGGEKWIARCRRVPEESPEVYCSGWEAAQRWGRFVTSNCSVCLEPSVTWQCDPLRDPACRSAGHRKDSASTSCCRGGWRALLLRLWIWVWWDVCGCWRESHQEPFQ